MLGERKDGEPMTSNTVSAIRDNGGRRLGIERRKYRYIMYIPERRSFRDRRSGSDRRKESDDSRGGIERRAAFV